MGTFWRVPDSHSLDTHPTNPASTQAGFFISRSRSAQEVVSSDYMTEWDYDFEDSEVAEVLANNLRRRRKEHSLSQGALAREINYSRTAITRIESRVNMCTVSTLLRICVVLKCTPNDLLAKPQP